MVEKMLSETCSIFLPSISSAACLNFLWYVNEQPKFKIKNYLSKEDPALFCGIDLTLVAGSKGIL